MLGRRLVEMQRGLEPLRFLCFLLFNNFCWESGRSKDQSRMSRAGRTRPPNVRTLRAYTRKIRPYSGQNAPCGFGCSRPPKSQVGRGSRTEGGAAEGKRVVRGQKAWWLAIPRSAFCAPRFVDSRTLDFRLPGLTR